MSEGILNMQRQLDSIKEFMQTEAYSSFRATMQADIAGCEQSILLLPPRTEEDRITVVELHERRATLIRQLSFFEEACDVLKSKLSDATEPKQ